MKRLPSKLTSLMQGHKEKKLARFYLDGVDCKGCIVDIDLCFSEHFNIKGNKDLESVKIEVKPNEKDIFKLSDVKVITDIDKIYIIGKQFPHLL